MINNKCVVSNINETSEKVLNNITKNSTKVLFPGVCIIIDDKKNVIGFVTDGDFRRAFKNKIDLKSSISAIMNHKPFSITKNELETNAPQLLKRWSLKNKKNVKYILVVDEQNKLKDIITTKEMLDKTKIPITLIGMGFVGVTLAAHILNEKIPVIAMDKDKNILNNLKNNLVKHVLEPGLNSIIKKANDINALECTNTLNDVFSNIFIISVGTPIDKRGSANTSAIQECSKDIGKILKVGDHIMMRSTVPVGTTRDIVIPILEKTSRLIAGKDFHISFTPERTAEGVALEELKSLPQIVGSLTQTCQEKAIKFWNKICPSIVSMKSLEAAELVKLSNNTFRDLSFAFANELCLLADKFNVNAFDLINAANEGYPRNKIAKPSPGVGGYCLTKDPLLYHNSFSKNKKNITFGLQSRKINEKLQYYPIDILDEFSKYKNLKLKKLNVLIIGIAFKGEPETNDTRGSVSLDLFHKLEKIVRKVYIFDWVVDAKNLKKITSNILIRLDDNINNFDAVFIMNNHKNNTLIETILSNKKSLLLFDGWNQINASLFLNNSKVVYSTLGYNTFRK